MQLHDYRVCRREEGSFIGSARHIPRPEFDNVPVWVMDIHSATTILVDLHVVPQARRRSTTSSKLSSSMYSA